MTLRLSLALSLIALAAPALAGPAPRPSAPAPDFDAAACAGYGPGYAPVPGTRTCLKVGGRVTSEARVTSGGRREGAATRFGNRAQVRAEAITPTELGPLRTVFEVSGGNLRGR